MLGQTMVCFASLEALLREAQVTSASSPGLKRGLFRVPPLTLAGGCHCLSGTCGAAGGLSVPSQGHPGPVRCF